MLDLAVHSGEGPQPLKEIAGRTGITIKYLEQIISKLVSAGLVLSSRGQSGGYVLGRPAKELHLSTILTVLEGPLIPVPCVEDLSQCNQATQCVTREIWQELSQTIWNTLDAILLSDMVRRYQEKQFNKEDILYHI